MKIKLASWIVALTLCLAAWLASVSQAVIEIEITEGGDDAIPIAVVPFGWQGEGAEPPADIAQIVADDLQRSGSFSPLNRADLVGSPVSGDTPRYGNWRLGGADYLVMGSMFERANGLVVEFQLFDILQQRLMTGFSFQVQGRSLRGAAHQIADEVYEEILGIPGAFNTQIAFITIEGEGRDRTHQLQLADADGFNAQTMLTSPRPIMSPAWAPDGIRIAYVSFENRDSSAIYVQDRQQGSRSKLISKPGINGAPSWSPDGQRLAVTLSYEGNPEIYTLDVDSGQLSRITNSGAIDTEARWIDDDTLVFTSDRSGGPQLYEVSASGGRASRITFEGNYNSNPTVSADGKSVAFVHAHPRATASPRSIGSRACSRC